MQPMIINAITEKALGFIPESGIIVGLVILACKAITMFLPTKLDGTKKWHKFANPVLFIMNKVALNIYMNKNAK